MNHYQCIIYFVITWTMALLNLHITVAADYDQCHLWNEIATCGTWPAVMTSMAIRQWGQRSGVGKMCRSNSEQTGHMIPVLPGLFSGTVWLQVGLESLFVWIITVKSCLCSSCGRLPSLRLSLHVCTPLCECVRDSSTHVTSRCENALWDNQYVWICF